MKQIISRIGRIVCSNLFLLMTVLGPQSLVLSDAADTKINFNRDIRPILSDKCFACHGLDKLARKADLRLDQRDAAIAMKAIVPGQPEMSSLVERIFSSDDDTVMPPRKVNKPLTEDQKRLLQRWIAEDAEYHPHWSFIPVPEETAVPNPPDADHWIKSPIDAFILTRLQQGQIQPALEVSREKWLRRVSFDLTGLPPTIAEIDAFLADHAPGAYERVVDRLLESSAFGERMANEWLDVARYADTFGYQSDRDTHVWPWRDWVIRAFNQNLPYDQFILWQTAGDLLPEASFDQQIATAFNRLHRQTNEGGSTEEEFRQSYIADRVVTNGTAFLGLTLECARCHDHKYDPITQADFYKLASFYSNIDEHGLYSHFTETAPTPAMPLYEGDQRSRHADLKAKIEAKEADLKRIRDQARERFIAHRLSKAKVTDWSTLLEALSEPAALTGQTGDNSEPKPEAGQVAAKLHLNFDDAKPSGENKLVPGISGQAIEFGGDDAFPAAGSGQYGRTSPLTVSLWVKPAEHKPRVVVLHQCVAAEDAAFRGLSLTLDNGYPLFSLIHFWPGNAIQVRSKQAIPIDQWTQIAVSYDGSSHAAGLHLYLNGQPVEVDVVKDNLTRDIKYRSEWGDSNGGVEMSLGARMRDVGFRRGAVDELMVYDRELSPLEITKVAVEGRKSVSPENTNVKLAADAVFEHYLLRFDEPYVSASKELQQLRNEENDLISQVRQIMAMQELPAPRPTHILKRGAYDAPGELVSADTPASILPFPQDSPRNRLGLAQWMISPRNPLTSRVAVNRFWNIFFGRGLVSSLEDFGGQGQLPTHPELLDWLARDFMNHRWNVKRQCKEIVLSATYRQSAQPRDSKLYSDDPENRLLGRGPRYRLSAEQIRDNALAVSGLLVPKLGGPSVMPYQPAGLWEEAGTGKSYSQSKGEGLYRRSLYTFWRRTSPPPSMLTFDATGRETCTARRERTATPLQSLVLLNDPQFTEAARVLAQKLIEQKGASLDERIQSAFRLLTSRNPTGREMQILNQMYREQKSHFEAVPESAREYLSIGDTPRDTNLNPADHAAMTVLVKSLMSFDECVTKR